MNVYMRAKTLHSLIPPGLHPPGVRRAVREQERRIQEEIVQHDSLFISHFCTSPLIPPSLHWETQEEIPHVLGHRAQLSQSRTRL